MRKLQDGKLVDMYADELNIQEITIPKMTEEFTIIFNDRSQIKYQLDEQTIHIPICNGITKNDSFFWECIASFISFVVVGIFIYTCHGKKWIFHLLLFLL